MQIGYHMYQGKDEVKKGEIWKQTKIHCMTLVYTRFNNFCEIHTHAQENINNITDASMNA